MRKCATRLFQRKSFHSPLGTLPDWQTLRNEGPTQVGGGEMPPLLGKSFPGHSKVSRRRRKGTFWLWLGVWFWVWSWVPFCPTLDCRRLVLAANNSTILRLARASPFSRSCSYFFPSSRSSSWSWSRSQFQFWY